MFDEKTGNTIPYREVIRHKRKTRAYDCPQCGTELVGTGMVEQNRRHNPERNDKLADVHCRACGAYVGTKEYFTL